MFSNSRNRFAAIIVINFIIILGATLFIIYFTTYSKMIEEDKQMLSTFASFYDLNGLPDNNSTNGLPSDLEDEKLPEGIDTSVSSQSRFQTSTFYAVVFDTDLNVIESMNDNPVQYTDDDLISMANTYLSGNKSFGLAQNLAYMITKGDDYILVTMMDTTAVSSAIASLFKYMIIFGAIAIVVLLLTSTLLASWVMQPLKKGYEKQKRFVSDAGHELKTPISTIKANTELLQREIGENKWLKNIIYENGRMNEIVHQLLDLAKLEQTRPIMTEVDLSRLCMACTLPFEAAAFESEILFSYDI
nr:hypothetical protein [Eubacterium sp.]